MDTESLRNLARELDLGDIADELTALAEWAIRLDYAPERSAGFGATKLGGLPDLPAGTPWPYAPPPLPEAGTPMLFLAQIALSEVAAFSVWPSELSGGLLSFFCAGEEGGAYVEDPGGAHVIYTTPEVPLERSSPPADLGETLGEVPLNVRPELTLPGHNARALEALGFDPNVIPIEGPEAERKQRYWELLERLDGAQGAGEPRHRLLGNPIPVQGDVFDEIASIGLRGRLNRYPTEEEELEETPRWRLLLQVDDDHDRLGVLWGDAGTVYFGIRAEDLAAGRFDGVEVVVQTT